MQTVLEQGSIDKPLTFDVGLIQLSFIPVCSLNTCNISVKLCRGFAALQCFSYYIGNAEIMITCFIEYNVYLTCSDLKPSNLPSNFSKKSVPHLENPCNFPYYQIAPTSFSQTNDWFTVNDKKAMSLKLNKKVQSLYWSII